MSALRKTTFGRRGSLVLAEIGNRYRVVRSACRQLAGGWSNGGPVPIGVKNGAAAPKAIGFQSSGAELSALPPSPIRTHLITAICLIFAVALVSSWLFSVDVYATAYGKIQPVGRSKAIESLYSGSVSYISVREGTKVKAGDRLIGLDKTDAVAETEAASLQTSELRAEIIRYRAGLGLILSGAFRNYRPAEFPKDMAPMLRERENTLLEADIEKLQAGLDTLATKIKQASAQQDTLRASIEGSDEIIRVLSQRLKMRSDLEKEGWESHANVLDATEAVSREIAKKLSDEAQMKEKVPEIEGYNAQQREQIAEFVANYEKGLSVAQASLDEKEQDLTKSYSKLRYADIVAPIDGTIQQISVTTIGQVVSPGQQLMTIVPLGGKLEIEALLENKDIGFVKPGQDAVVKVDAFPFSRYGTIAGAVARISRDSVGSVEAVSSTDTQQKVVEAKESAAAPVPSTHNLVYPVIITLKSDTINVENKPTPLSAGMTAVVEIRTGSRSVLEYLFSPFIEAKSQAFHER